jgi:ribosomal protein L11 methyltransferase
MTEIVADILLGLGSAGVNIRDKFDLEELLNRKGRWDYVGDDLYASFGEKARVSGYFEDKRIAEELAVRLAALKSFFAETGDLSVDVSEVREEDYINEWKKYYTPIEVGRVIIIPEWQTAESDKIKVYIDPGLAFGTGGHETTRLCIGLMQDCIRTGARVADVGCGSGILGVCAVKLGAEYCLMTDIDPIAVQAARANCRLNGVTDAEAEILEGNLLDMSDIEADVIVANITADILIGLMNGLKKRLKPDGTVIFSGILDSRLNDVKQAARAAGLCIGREEALGEWRALSCKHV